MLLGPWGQRKVREMVFGPAPAVTPDTVKPLVAPMGLVGASLRSRIVKIPRLSDADLAGLPRVLVIVGGRDVLIDSEGTRRRLAAHAPNAEVVYLPDGRHFIPGQTGAILDFLRGMRGAHPRPPSRKIFDAEPAENAQNAQG